MHTLTRNDAAALTLNDRQHPRSQAAVTAGGSPPSELDRSAGATGASSRDVLNPYVCLAVEMADLGIHLYRQRMRREHPGASDEQIEARVQGWLMRRAGDYSARS